MTDKFKDDILNITNVLEHIDEESLWIVIRKGGIIDEIFIGTGYRDFGDENGFV